MSELHISKNIVEGLKKSRLDYIVNTEGWARVTQQSKVLNMPHANVLLTSAPEWQAPIDEHVQEIEEIHQQVEECIPTLLMTQALALH